MKVTRRIALTLGAAALVATGCSGTGASGGSDITIGLAVSTLNNPFFVELQQGAQEMADKLGAKLTVVDAQNDATNQVNQVQTLVTQGVKAILLNPVDSKQSAPAAKAAEMANIPLISVDRAVEGKVAAEVASNNVSGGSLAAIELGRATSGDVAHLKGIPGASASRDRGQGFEQGLNSGNIKVVASAVADFDRAKGLNETTNLLQGNPGLKGIFAENDEMALGAIKALGARALQGRPGRRLRRHAGRPEGDPGRHARRDRRAAAEAPRFQGRRAGRARRQGRAGSAGRGRRGQGHHREERGRVHQVTNALLVLGSANADLVVEVGRRPTGGETVLGGDTVVLPGGKGANTAVAAARVGASVALIGAVGGDGYGSLLRESLESSGVDTALVKTSARPTGIAYITVTPDGENSIVVSPGANADVSLSDVDDISFDGAQVLTCSLEVPLETVIHAIGVAS